MASKGIAPSQIAMEDKWRTEDDLRCLQRAAEIKKDAKRLAKVKKLAREQLEALKSVSSGS